MSDAVPDYMERPLDEAPAFGAFEFEIHERLVATIDPADYRSRDMDISTHWEDCWRAHMRCATEMVVRLTRTVRELRDALDVAQEDSARLDHETTLRSENGAEIILRWRDVIASCEGYHGVGRTRSGRQSKDGGTNG